MYFLNLGVKGFQDADRNLARCPFSQLQSQCTWSKYRIICYRHYYLVPLEAADGLICLLLIFTTGSCTNVRPPPTASGESRLAYKVSNTSQDRWVDSWIYHQKNFWSMATQASGSMLLFLPMNVSLRLTKDDGTCVLSHFVIIVALCNTCRTL